MCFQKFYDLSAGSAGALIILLCSMHLKSVSNPRNFHERRGQVSIPILNPIEEFKVDSSDNKVGLYMDLVERKLVSKEIFRSIIG